MIHTQQEFCLAFTGYPMIIGQKLRGGREGEVELPMWLVNKFSLIAIQKQIEGEGKSGWKGFFGGEGRRGVKGWQSKNARSVKVCRAWSMFLIAMTWHLEGEGNGDLHRCSTSKTLFTFLLPLKRACQPRHCGTSSSRWWPSYSAFKWQTLGRE